MLARSCAICEAVHTSGSEATDVGVHCRVNRGSRRCRRRDGKASHILTSFRVTLCFEQNGRCTRDGAVPKEKERRKERFILNAQNATPARAAAHILALGGEKPHANDAHQPAALAAHPSSPTLTWLWLSSVLHTDVLFVRARTPPIHLLHDGGGGRTHGGRGARETP